LTANSFRIDPQQQRETIDAAVILEQQKILFGGGLLEVGNEPPIRQITRHVEAPFVCHPVDRSVCLVDPLRNDTETPGNVGDPTYLERGPGPPDRRHDRFPELLGLLQLDVQRE
jgi:hypothetical protein